jgi:hypothetical protein
MQTLIKISKIALSAGVGISGMANAQEILPFPPVPSASDAGLTMQTSKYQTRQVPRHLPENAPNIIIILLDDLGPGVASTYGGEVNTPTLTAVASNGISFNRFHSCAMSSPSRASLLTGRNQRDHSQNSSNGCGSP